MRPHHDDGRPIHGRARRRSGRRCRSTAAGVLVTALTVASCGGDDTTDAPSEPATAADDAATDEVGEPAADDGAAPSFGEGSAEVTIDGETHRYATVDGVMTACTSIGGSLQVVLPEVDDAGAVVPDGELKVYLLEPDADPALHSPPSIEVELADGTSYVAGDADFGGEGPPVELRPDGRAASGTVQLVRAFEPDTVVGADISIQC